MIFFDMDGVLAKYDRGGYNFEEEDGPNYLKKGYFLEREPDSGAVALFRKCLKVCPNDIYIITSVPSGDKRNSIIFDKLAWIDKYLPEFDIGTHFIATTSSKMSFIEWLRGSSITSKDILIDDYNPNLYSWMSRGGTAIKYINNVNSVDSWVGSYIAEYMEDSVMFDFLMRVVMETNK